MHISGLFLVVARGLVERVPRSAPPTIEFAGTYQLSAAEPESGTRCENSLQRRSSPHRGSPTTYNPPWLKGGARGGVGSTVGNRCERLGIGMNPLLTETGSGRPSESGNRSRRTSSISRSRGPYSKARWVWLPVLLVLLTVLSGVPTATWESLGATPTIAPAPPTTASPELQTLPPVANASAPINRESLCLLGATPGCLPLAARPAGAVAPEGEIPCRPGPT